MAVWLQGLQDLAGHASHCIGADILDALFPSLWAYVDKTDLLIIEHMVKSLLK